MIIANPIYDVVFKKMMENERVAKFFIGTLLDETIEKVEVMPQEFTYIKDIDQDDPLMQQYIKAKIQERLSINVMRLDFVATIQTPDGKSKKVLIEIQKAKNQIDLMRFRNYLAEQYKKQEEVSGKKSILPITTIYILGFKIAELDSPCVHIERQYKDLISKKIISKRSDFVEKLTHDSFIVQVERISGRFQTKLDKLLSLFEQSHFLDETKIIKEFHHLVDNDDLAVAAGILHYSGTNAAERKAIAIEQEAWRSIEAFVEDTENELEESKKEIAEKEKALEESKKVIEQSKKVIEEKDKVLEEKDKENEFLKKQLEELMRKLNENK